MTVTAHSGAYDTPDNSLAYIRTVLEKGDEILEIDVTFRPSGTPVVIHKVSPGETEGVLLEDVFHLVAQSPSLRLNLDLKSVKNLPAVDALLKQYGLFDRAFFTGVDKQKIKKVRETSAVPYYFNADVSLFAKKYPGYAKRLALRVKDLGALGLNCHYGNAAAPVINALHEAGLAASFWTVNDEETAKKILPLGADNITSRHPDMIRRVLKELE